MNRSEDTSSKRARPEYDGYHAMIFDLVPEKSRVLDVGCATGKLAEQLRRRKKCFVVGIECEEYMAELAKTRCDQVLVADVETMKLLPFPDGFFDVIVLADVLEHLAQPSCVLARFRRYLKDGGMVLVSIPNVANWRIRLGLLLGKFDYSEYGILDVNHLRFFTAKTLKAMIEDNGYVIVLLRGYNYFLYYHLKKSIGILKSLLGYQLVAKALKCSKHCKHVTASLCA